MLEGQKRVRTAPHERKYVGPPAQPLRFGLLVVGLATLIVMVVLAFRFIASGEPAAIDLADPGAIDLVVLSAGDEQSQDIFLADPDSGERTNLTDNEFSDLTPACSPDGERIAFYSNRDSEDERWFDLYVMNADGSNVQRVAEGRFNATTPPAWSPNGDEIAAIWIGESPELPNDVAELRVITVETGDSHTVYEVESSNGTQTNLLGPISWSPDGQRIAVYQIGPGAVSGTAIVHVERRLEAFIEHAQDARWSPVENRLAYIQDSHLDDDGLYVTAADEFDPQLVVPASDDTTIESLAWSPDGNRLLASMSTTMPLTSIDLAEINAENGDIRWLQVVDDKHPVAGNASWSRDMDEIVYVASYLKTDDAEEQREIELRIIRSDGEIETLMSAERINPPQWRPRD